MSKARTVVLKLSDHAKKQRIERKIPLEQIIKTVKNPKIKAKSFKNRELRQREFGDKILEVVVIQEEETLVVVTQYYMEE